MESPKCAKLLPLGPDTPELGAHNNQTQNQVREQPEILVMWVPEWSWEEHVF